MSNPTVVLCCVGDGVLTIRNDGLNLHDGDVNNLRRGLSHSFRLFAEEIKRDIQ